MFNEKMKTMVENRKFDLIERTAKFGEATIRFSKKVPRNVVNNPLIRQLVRSGTSVGANNCEANEAVSRKDFRNKIGICKKEISETKYWLRMISESEPELKEHTRKLWVEANELHMIFASSFRTVSKEKDADKS